MFGSLLNTSMMFYSRSKVLHKRLLSLLLFKDFYSLLKVFRKRLLSSMMFSSFFYSLLSSILFYSLLFFDVLFYSLPKKPFPSDFVAYDFVAYDFVNRNSTKLTILFSYLLSSPTNSSNTSSLPVNTSTLYSLSLK